MKTRYGAMLVIVLTVCSISFAGATASAQSESTTITLNGNTASIDGDGAEVAGSIVTITAAGTYNLNGTLSEGQIIVDTEDAVIITLNGVEISSTAGAPIDIQKAESVAIVLADGSQNTITSGAEYVEDTPNAAILSSADLTISGSGSLTVVSTANDGIRSSASLTIDGTPVLAVSAGVDAIQAEENIVIENGSITIDAADDGIRSDKDLVMNAGTLDITVVGKAIHASYNLELNNGSVYVSTCDEGIEGGFITINDGSYNITATDDGINVSEPDDVPAPDLYYLHINGGNIVVSADGDGLDSNGSIEMTGGTVIVNGPTAFDNGALDYDGTFNMIGGLLIAAGSAGMPSAPSQTSTQYSVLVNFDSALEAGTLVHIQTAEGEDLLTFAPSKPFQSIVFSSPELTEGAAYDIYYGGTSDGTATNGLYDGGTYTPGTQQVNFTVSSINTLLGNVMMGPGGHGGQGQPPQGGMPQQGGAGPRG